MRSLDSLPVSDNHQMNAMEPGTMSSETLPLSLDHLTATSIEDAQCPFEDSVTSWLNQGYACHLAAQNLTYLCEDGDSLADHARTSTPVEEQSGELPAVAEGLKSDDVVILKYLISIFVRKVLHRILVSECYGCRVDHPSQRRHSCLYEPHIFYYDTRYDEICEGLFTPTLTDALGYAIRTVSGKTVTPCRILGGVDVITNDMRSEPYIVEKLDQVIKDTDGLLIDHALGRIMHLWKGGDPADHP